MAETRYLSELFSIQPPNWGLRGDPFLWEDMKKSFAAVPFPYNSRDLVNDIKRIFLEKTGEELSNSARPFVKEYDHGGSSSGKVSGRFWLNTAIPLLLSLRDIAESNMQEFDKILAEGTARYALRSHPCTPD
ncbi:MAG: hypothetical protein J6I40_01900 [Mailhella sp.]|nr:hypothetical protein [Mailhella sp.]